MIKKIQLKVFKEQVLLSLLHFQLTKKKKKIAIPNV